MQNLSPFTAAQNRNSFLLLLLLLLLSLSLMAFSATAHCPSLLRIPKASSSLPQPSALVSFRPSHANINLRKRLCIRSSSAAAAPTSGGVAPAVSLTDDAMKHLNKMRSERNEDLCLRIGVKQGGCSGMSYTMEFEKRANARPDDSIIEYNGFVMVCDPKSLLFLYGMQLDFSDALIGGGFSFKNPNATQTCGCGKSFAAEM
ncbi:iron-sulfur assembly protein IscA, chloroplastic [Malania oleifera]|uniref:iron-sulfur assembly protein IscA, chloroplastic n=1 Tax=Malania oleifera TaxID=397392 RepID=UPI0025AE9883|nr:iron-sulfur assembly protein IscA, chloroplastic [Malania oleifera]